MTPRPSILVVDDESAILDTVRILLKNEGFDVTVAQGGRAGLEALEKELPAIVLSDVRTPPASTSSRRLAPGMRTCPSFS